MPIAETSQSSGENETTTIPNTNSAVYEGNTNVLLNGYVNGNSFLMGQKVTISGYVKGDLFVMANSLVIESGAEVTGTVFALAKEIKISGKVNDVYALSQEFTLAENGFVARDLNLSVSTATFQGKVGRDVNLSANTLSFDEGAKNLIGGDLNYSTPNEVTIPEDVVIGKIYPVGKARYKVTSKKAVMLVSYKKPGAKKMNIPSTVRINGRQFKVTAIGANVCKGNKKLTTVTIGKNVKSIAAKAFYKNKNLKKINIKSVTIAKIGKNAFKGIHKKAVFVVPKKAKKKLRKKLTAKVGFQKKTMKIK